MKINETTIEIDEITMKIDEITINTSETTAKFKQRTIKIIRNDRLQESKMTTQMQIDQKMKK